MNLLTAEILKLRKRRGLMIWSSLLTVGSVVVAYGVLLGLHAFNPDHHGPAGGVENLQNLMWLLANLRRVAAVPVGAAARAPGSRLAGHGSRCVPGPRRHRTLSPDALPRAHPGRARRVSAHARDGLRAGGRRLVRVRRRAADGEPAPGRPLRNRRRRARRRHP